MARQHFSKADQEKIVNAIKEAELATSGEIRVHIESKTLLDPMERAKELFISLGMGNTDLKNGVLIYLAFDDRKLAIIGDSGIHEKVGDDFWQAESELMKKHFAKGEFAIGLSAAIEQVGEKLKVFFPYHHQDTNELSNEISFGGDKHE